MKELAEKIRSAAADLRRLEGGWYPSKDDLANAVVLNDWLEGIESQTNQHVLWGQSVNHPILGTRLITTSPVLWISEDRTIARTLSRWYSLGKPTAPVTVREPSADRSDLEDLGPPRG
jgi:hypothetical protein